MTRSIVGSAATFAALLLASSPSAAMVAVLSDAQVHAAIVEGRAAALHHEGLDEAPYVAYQSPDALRYDSERSDIDAIVVGTPYERVRYAAYLAAFQGMSRMSNDAMSDAATPMSIDVIVFAHARRPGDQGFLKRIEHVALDVDGLALVPETSKLEGPTEDFFDGPSGRELLWTGDDSYRFDLSRVADRGIDPTNARATFTLTDPYGREFVVKLDLARYH